MNNTDPTATPQGYENNPFFVAITGLKLLFQKARSIGIILAVLAGLSLLTSLPSLFAPGSNPDSAARHRMTAINHQTAADLSRMPAEVWVLLAAIILLVIITALFIGILFRGILDYTSARLAVGEAVTVRAALRAVLSNFWSYTWVLVVVSFKTLLWTLLFIIPGFVMSYRYSLTGVAFFDKALKGGAASSASAALTKGAWLTTYASQSLLNIITLGLIPSLLEPGTNAVLYHQFKNAEGVKPRAHLLSWLTLLVPLALVALIVGTILLFARAASQQP